MTFTSLQAQIVQYLERGSALDPVFNAAMPTLINQAERRIARDVKVLGFIQTVQSTMVAGTWVLAKPDRWRQTVSINYGSGIGVTGIVNSLFTPIFPRSLEYVKAYNTDINALSGPRFWAEYNYANIMIAPTPDVAYPYEWIYYEQPALLDVTNGTNFITTYASNLLLFGSLVESSIFLKNPEAAQEFDKTYLRELASLNSEDKNHVLSRDVTRQDT
jgi:hypothetical protein